MPTMKKYILPFILLLSLLLTACGAQPSGGEEAPWQTALRQTGEYLLAQDAPSAGPVNGDWTVVGLRAAGLLERETAAVYYESVMEYTAQADTIGGLLGFHHVFGRSIYVGGTEPYGNGLVSRYPIASSEVIPIPDPIVDGRVPDGVESRSVLRCTFDFAGGKHLTVLALPERENAAALCRKLLETEENPTILLGDFNSTPDEGILWRLRRDYRSVGDFRKCTFPTDKPNIRIDYIFLNDRVALRRHGIGPTSASDHLPVWADVQI